MFWIKNTQQAYSKIDNGKIANSYKSKTDQEENERNYQLQKFKAILQTRNLRHCGICSYQ